MHVIHAHYEPSGDGPHPTIIALHGWGASAMDLLGLAPLLMGGRVQVICPQGRLTVPLGGGAAGYGWFPLTGAGQAATGETVKQATNEVRSFIDAACARYPIDERKLAVLGFSQGGVLAYRLALDDPTRFAGLVALSSWLPPALASDISATDAHSALPTLVQHGTGDEIIAVARAQQSATSLRALGIPVTYQEYEMGHEINAKSFGDLSRWLQELLEAAA